MWDEGWGQYGLLYRYGLLEVFAGSGGMGANGPSRREEGALERLETHFHRHTHHMLFCAYCGDGLVALCHGAVVTIAASVKRDSCMKVLRAGESIGQ